MKDRNGNTLKATGDCFTNCAKYVLDADETMTLVHAIVTGKGRIDGIDYGHAFVIRGDFAIDLTRSLSSPILVPLKLYRELGRIRNEIHYSPEQARQLLATTGQFGPWDTSIQTDADKFCARGKAR